MLYSYYSNSNKESNFFSEAKLRQRVNLGVMTEGMEYGSDCRLTNEKS